VNYRGSRSANAAGGVHSNTDEDFSTFVESALSPLGLDMIPGFAMGGIGIGGGGAGQSPSRFPGLGGLGSEDSNGATSMGGLSAHSNEHDIIHGSDSNHGSTYNGGLSGPNSLSGAGMWSPSGSVMSHGNSLHHFDTNTWTSSSPLGPGNGTGGTHNQSGNQGSSHMHQNAISSQNSSQASSAAHTDSGTGSRSMRAHKPSKKHFDHNAYEGATQNDIINSEQDVLYNNSRQALADRLKYDSDGRTGSHSGAGMGLGIAGSDATSSGSNHYLGSSLALDSIGSPMGGGGDPMTHAPVQATGRGARERKQTPKSRAQYSSSGSTGGKSSRTSQAYNTNTPTSEFLDLGLGDSGKLPRGPLTCNCKKSRCLKLYCECFHALKFCSNCKCFDCENRVGNEDVRNSVINTIRDRDPHAFESKVRVVDGSDGNARAHLSGCHCKRTSCLKKYCECFTLAVPCSQRCRCLKCQNNASLYEVKIDDAKYTAAMLVSAAGAAIDESGGDEYLSGGITSTSRNANSTDNSSEEGGYDSRGGRSSVSSRTMGGRGDQSPVSDSGRRYGYVASVSGYGSTGPVPSSPGMSLLDLAGACTEQEKHEEAREGLLALSPQRKVYPLKAQGRDVSSVQPLQNRLKLETE
jgi:hypothetical protein